MSLDRLFGREGPVGFMLVPATFVAFVLLDRLTLQLVALPSAEWFGSVLVVEALAANPFVAGLAVLASAGVAVVGRERLLARWGELDQGALLRAFGGAVALWLAWRMAAYDFNYVLARWHAVDRTVVVALALGCLLRPVFLLPFVAQVRLINGQFSYPLGTTFGQAVDELMVLVLLALSAAHLLYAVTGKRSTTPALLVIMSAVAAHFFVPGRAKLALDWLATNETQNFALNSYTAGWRGQGDGAYARSLARLIEAVNGPLKAATLAMELGAVVAVAHYKLFRMWLPMFIAFHVATLLLCGFFFLEWVLLEVALLGALLAPSLRAWVEENATAARGLVAVLAVASGTVLFHPPALAWLDGPVAYGYEIEAEGASGRSYHVTAASFAPFEQELTFGRLALSPTPAAAGGYGAVGSSARHEDLVDLADLEELTRYEAGLEPTTPYPDARTELLLTRFFERLDTGPAAVPRWLGPPARFRSGRPEPTFDGGETLDEMRVVLVRSLIVGGAQRFSRATVLTVGRDPTGRVRVLIRGPRPGS